jgi:hypothetical protein
MAETGDVMGAGKGGWTDDPKGPDISITNSGLTVTRTNSSGWGSALWTETLSSTRLKINFHLDNDGDSNYLYVGAMEAGSGTFNLSSVLSNDYSRPLWTWKRNGEFHKQGDSESKSEARLSTGDDFSIFYDMVEKAITFYKGTNEVHTFTGISEEVIPCICFGGSN